MKSFVKEIKKDKGFVARTAFLYDFLRFLEDSDVIEFDGDEEDNRDYLVCAFVGNVIAKEEEK